MTVPASPLEWRQLSDRVVYARQACAGDNVSLYPATHTVSCEEDGAQEGFLDAPPPPEPPIEDTKPAAADKPRPKAVKPLKGSKKLDPMIGKWKAARAEIEDFEKRNKKQTEMSPEELEEAKNRELKEWRQEQGNRCDMPPPCICMCIPMCLWGMVDPLHWRICGCCVTIAGGKKVTVPTAAAYVSPFCMPFIPCKSIQQGWIVTLNFGQACHFLLCMCAGVWSNANTTAAALPHICVAMSLPMERDVKMY